jgi:hypothetical protein
MINLRPHQERTVNAMWDNTKGQIIIPTGGGKTLCMIEDVLANIDLVKKPQTFVVVAPRILLAEQLSSEFLEHIKGTEVLHVHSGETPHISTTKVDKIRLHHAICKTAGVHQLIFTTYHSLHRVVDANIKVDTIYFDEAHNSVQKNFYESVEHYATFAAKRCFFFTATPKHSLTPSKPGMNNHAVYGEVISKVPAPELIEGGYIIPPKVTARTMPLVINSVEERDCKMILDILKSESDMDKVMVAAKSTKNINNLVTRTKFVPMCNLMGYDVLWITSKYGAFINGDKVARDKFFDTMNEWGSDPDRKFIMFHHSILAEGINVSGLTACILMRNLDYVTMAQTIGRVIRLNKQDASNIANGTLTPCNFSEYRKPFGKMFVPVYANVGISTHKRLQSVVDIIFEQGDAAVSTVRK